MSKTLIAGAVTAAALAVGGGAFAATQLGSDADEQAILNDAASRLGVEPSELEAALEAAFVARIDAAVAAGRLAQEQADRMKERLAEGGLPLFGGGPGPHGHMLVHGGLEAAASYLGLTEAELREALRDGQTLAEIAAEEGKTINGLKEAMVADATERLAPPSRTAGSPRSRNSASSRSYRSASTPSSRVSSRLRPAAGRTLNRRFLPSPEPGGSPTGRG